MGRPRSVPRACIEHGRLCSRRVIVVPIIDAFGNDKTDFEVQGFELMYLIGYANGSQRQGNDCHIQCIFVDADVSVNAISCSTARRRPASSTRTRRSISSASSSNGRNTANSSQAFHHSGEALAAFSIAAFYGLSLACRCYQWRRSPVLIWVGGTGRSLGRRRIGCTHDGRGPETR